MLKLIESAPGLELALFIACLKEPAPESSVLITVNIAEGLVSVFFGLEDESMSLFGFGLDSFVEVISGVGIWHMIRRIRQNEGENPDRFEQRALRITGTGFYLLTAGLAITAVVDLYRGHKPETTFWGIVISLVSILSMWLLIHYKVKVGKQLSSPAILADAACTRACLQLSVVLAILLNGCVTTKEISVDYPIPSEAIQAINASGGEAQIVLASGDTAAVYELTVDSLMARWKVGEWRGVPVADLVSVTVRDETETTKHMLTGVLYSAAAFGVIGLIDALSQDRAGVAGEVLLSAGVGGVLAVATSSVWAPMTEARICYSVRPPRIAEDTIRREADRSRTEARVQAMITDLNIRSRNFRIEPTFLYVAQKP